MRSQAPARLHWVQVREALESRAGWRSGRLVRIESDSATVVALGPQGADGIVSLLTVRHPDELTRAVAGGIAHPRGGHRVLWSVPGRILAVPVVASCEVGADAIELDSRAIIVEERRRFSLVAEDSSWTCRLFDATDLAAIVASRDEAEARMAARTDRSTLFPKLRSSLLPDHRGAPRD